MDDKTRAQILASGAFTRAQADALLKLTGPEAPGGYLPQWQDIDPATMATVLQLTALQAQLGNYLPITGGAITGGLTVNGGIVSAGGVVSSDNSFIGGGNFAVLTPGRGSGLNGAVLIRPRGESDSSVQLEINSGNGMNYTGGMVLGGALSASGATVNGNDVWHAGTFNPNTKLNANDPVGTGWLRIDVNNGSTGQLIVRNYQTDGVTIDAVNENNSAYAPLNLRGTSLTYNDMSVWHAGNHNPSAPQDVRSGVNGTQAFMQSMGWATGGMRWGTVLEPDASLSLYSYLADGQGGLPILTLGNKASGHTTSSLRTALRVSGWSGNNANGLIYLGNANQYIYGRNGNDIEFNTGAGSFAVLNSGGTIRTSVNTPDAPPIYSVAPGGADINVVVNGFRGFVMNGEYANAPGGWTSWASVVQHIDVDWGFQIVHPWFSDELYYRRRVSGAWYGYARIWHEGIFNPATKQDARSELNAVAKTINDWNTVLTNGWFMGVGTANAPSAGWLLGIVTVHNSDWVTQEVTEFAATGTSPKEFRRQRQGGAWTAWVQVGRVVVSATDPGGNDGTIWVQP